MNDVHYIKELTTDLMTRLPELEWKINDLNPILFARSIPRRLFRTQDVTALSCINELKLEISSLAKQKNSLSAHYLAEQIKQKINVLVGLCRVEQKNKKVKSPASFSLNMLSTRQQWLQTIERDVDVLIKQQQALAKTLKQMQLQRTDPDTILNLKSELGEIEKRLTLAQEALAKAIS
jgi:DNA-binding transcriptional MerR regulator